MDWLGLKLDLVAVTGLDKDALHIYAAVLVQTAVALITRTGFRSVLPWLAVAAVEGTNEWADMYFEVWPDRTLQLSRGIHDIVNTMIMPTFLLLFARLHARPAPPITEPAAAEPPVCEPAA